MEGVDNQILNDIPTEIALQMGLVESRVAGIEASIAAILSEVGMQAGEVQPTRHNIATPTQPPTQPPTTDPLQQQQGDPWAGNQRTTAPQQTAQANLLDLTAVPNVAPVQTSPFNGAGAPKGILAPPIAPGAVPPNPQGVDV